MVNVGLVTGPATPSARQAPRTNVVFPAPISPRTSTRSPGASRAASSPAAVSVASGLELLIGRAHAQAGTGQHEREAGEEHQAQVAAGVRQVAGAGRSRGRRARRRGPAAARGAAAVAEARVLREAAVVALRARPRVVAAPVAAAARGRAGVARERIAVLIVAGT